MCVCVYVCMHVCLHRVCVGACHCIGVCVCVCGVKERIQPTILDEVRVMHKSCDLD